MKKSIIALTVAAASLAGVAQADGTTLYGSARFVYNYVDNVYVVDPTGNSQMDLGRPARRALSGNGQSVSYAGNNPYASSRFGIKGSNDLGNGLSANYVFEMGVGGGGAVGQRDMYANLAGSFGAVQIGQFILPYDGVVAYTDIFNGVGGGYSVRDFEAIGLPGRVNNVLAYVSPNWNGFNFTAGVVMNGALGLSGASHVDAQQVTASYDNNGIHAALGYLKVSNYGNGGVPVDGANLAGQPRSGDDLDALNLSVGYSNDTFMVGLSAEKIGLDYPGRADDRDPWSVTLAGRYNIDEANSIYASAGVYDYDISGLNAVNTPRTPGKAKAFGLGYQHNFSAQTRVWAEYEYVDSNIVTPVGSPQDTDQNTVSLGLRTDF